MLGKATERKTAPENKMGQGNQKKAPGQTVKKTGDHQIKGPLWQQDPSQKLNQTIAIP